MACDGDSLVVDDVRVDNSRVVARDCFALELKLELQLTPLAFIDPSLLRSLSIAPSRAGKFHCRDGKITYNPTILFVSGGIGNL